MTKAPLFALLALIPVQGYQRAESPSKIFAVGEKGAYLMAPAELACGSYVRSLDWTADGNYLVAERLVVSDGTSPRDLLVARQRADLKGIEGLSRRRELVAWSPRSHRSRTLFAYDSAGTSLGSLEPVPNSDRLYTRLEERFPEPSSGNVVVRRSFAIISVGSGTIVRIPLIDPEGSEGLEFSAKGLGALTRRGKTASGSFTTVSFIGLDGRIGHTFTLPERAFFGFEDDGTPSLGLMTVDAKGKRRIEFYRYDTVNGAVGGVIRPHKVAEAMTPTAADADASDGNVVDRGAKAPPPELAVGEELLTPASRGVVLRVAPGDKMDNVGLVTGDGTNPMLSPKNDAIAYLSGGSAYVRTLTKLSLKDFALAVALAEREKLMDRGRQIGLALAMYASDADDAMPPAGADVKSIVSPYIRDRDTFDGFNYTFGGPLPPTGRDSLEVGSMSGPGGRVVVYADGSVKWVPDGS